MTVCRRDRKRVEDRLLRVGDLAILDMSGYYTTESAPLRSQHCIIMSFSETIPTLATILCDGELRTVHIDFLIRVLSP